MISLVSSAFSVLLLFLVFGLVACKESQGKGLDASQQSWQDSQEKGLVVSQHNRQDNSEKIFYDDDWVRKQNIIDSIKFVKENIANHEKRLKIEENEERQRMVDLKNRFYANFIRFLLSSAGVVIMVIAIYKCLKNNEEIYRNQG